MQSDDTQPLADVRLLSVNARFFPPILGPPDKDDDYSSPSLDLLDRWP